MRFNYGKGSPLKTITGWDWVLNLRGARKRREGQGKRALEAVKTYSGAATRNQLTKETK